MTIFYSTIARDETILVSHEKGINHFEDAVISMLKNIPDANIKITYTSSKFLFHVTVENQLIFLCVTESDFGKRIPYAFLDQIRQKFNQTSLPSRSYNARSHEFDQDFGHVLSQEMDRFSSGDTGDKISQLKSQVEEVRDVLTENINKILQRGENLEDLISKTSDLEESSKMFHTTSRRISRKFWWKNVRIWIIIGIIASIILTFIILLATGTIPT